MVNFPGYLTRFNYLETMLYCKQFDFVVTQNRIWNVSEFKFTIKSNLQRFSLYSITYFIVLFFHYICFKNLRSIIEIFGTSSDEGYFGHSFIKTNFYKRLIYGNFNFTAIISIFNWCFIKSHNLGCVWWQNLAANWIIK